MKYIFLVSLIASLCLSPFVRGDDAKDDNKLIQGTWMAESAELGGRNFRMRFARALSSSSRTASTR